MSAAELPRRGCNEAEAMVLWAMGHFGGEAELLRHLPDEVSGTLRPVVEAFEGLDEDGKDEVLSQWQEEIGPGREVWREVLVSKAGWCRESVLGPMDGRWRRVLGALANPVSAQGPPDPVGHLLVRMLLPPLIEAWVPPALPGGESHEAGPFDVLARLEPAVLVERIERFGTFHFAAFARHHDRRQIAMVLHSLDEPRRARLLEYMRVVGDWDVQHRKRVGEVFLVVGRRHAEFSERFLHLGLYFLACAVGRRFRRHGVYLSHRLPAKLRFAFWQYHEIHDVSSRRQITPVVRERLVGFLTYLREQEMNNEEGCHDASGG